jgi:hypothetical protein
MRGHIVWSFGVVVIWPILGREMIEIGFDVVAHCGVGILLDQE